MAVKRINPSAMMSKAVETLTIWHEARSALRGVERNEKQAKVNALAAMQSLSTKTVVFESMGTQVRATLVEASSIVVDEAKLKKAVGAAVWNKCLTPMFDRAKLEQLIAGGTISPVVVASCSTEVPKQAYIKLTEKVMQDEDTEGTQVVPDQVRAKGGKR